MTFERVVCNIRIKDARVTSSQTSGSSELPIGKRLVLLSVDHASGSIRQDPKGGTTDGVPQTIECK